MRAKCPGRELAATRTRTRTRSPETARPPRLLIMSRNRSKERDTFQGGARFAVLHMDDERLQLEFEGLLTWNSVKGDVIEEPSFLCENFSKFHDDAYEVIIDEGQYNHLDIFISPSF
jgi:hypothetical protein